MKSIEKQTFIRLRASENRYSSDGEKILWSRHAVAALIDDELRRIDVETALRQCEIIEDYQLIHRPLPDCLVLSTLPFNRPIHAVVAIDVANDRIFIVTVYIPTEDRRQNDWRTRK